MPPKLRRSLKIMIQVYIQLPKSVGKINPLQTTTSMEILCSKPKNSNHVFFFFQRNEWKVLMFVDKCGE